MYWNFVEIDGVMKNQYFRNSTLAPYYTTIFFTYLSMDVKLKLGSNTSSQYFMHKYQTQIFH
jgi:hypothetical protein